MLGIRRKWRLLRFDITDHYRYIPPGDVDHEQLFWTVYGAQRAKEKLNYHHYMWKSPYRFEVAER